MFLNTLTKKIEANCKITTFFCSGIINLLFDGLAYNASGHFAHCSYVSSPQRGSEKYDATRKMGINTVCYFTKFAIPPLSSLPRGRESNPSPCVPRHISPVWPGGLLLEQADDMCQRNLPNNQGREKSKCDKFFHYKTTSWSSSVSEFNGIASWNLAWFLEKKYRYNWSKCRRASKMRSCEDFSGLRPKKIREKTTLNPHSLVFVTLLKDF